MTATALYKSLSDEQRLRILHLLAVGPLCVCHLETILGESQVKISKQLRFLKDQELVESKRCAQWMVYSLSNPEDVLLRANLTALREDETLAAQLDGDMQRRTEIIREVEQQSLSHLLCEEACDCLPEVALS